jgi:hypothetical protein
MRRRNFIRFFEAREYATAESNNPLFPVTRRWTHLWPVFAVGLIVLSFVVAMGVVIFGPALKLRAITIEGTTTLDPTLLEASVRAQFQHQAVGIFPGDQRWFFRPLVTERNLLEDFPLKTVSVIAQADHVHVKVVEDISMIALRSGDHVYIINPDGKIIREASPEELQAVLEKAQTGLSPALEAGQRALIQADMPIIREQQPGAHALDDQVFDHATILAIIQFSDGLSAQGLIPREFIREDDQASWFSVTSDQEYVVMFDAEQDIATQLTVLKTVLEQYFATQEDKPKYIDVRFGTRVYTR